MHLLTRTINNKNYILSTIQNLRPTMSDMWITGLFNDRGRGARRRELLIIYCDIALDFCALIAREIL